MIKLDNLIIYLRKSRQDDQKETVEEVLAKHETILHEYCLREFGGQVPDENIYREVVSGESIAAREEVRKVLARIEDPAITGVVVVEPSRLSRGDLADCAKLITAFRFSHTLVITPMMTYNLENKMERKFFQDELLRGNDFLEYTKELLTRGRIAAVKRGCYIHNRAPFGYNRIMIDKDHTLEPNEDADTVRMIFTLYTEEHMTRKQIAEHLEAMKIKSPRGTTEWHKDTVRHILQNLHYIGKVFYYQTKITLVMENGVLVKKQLKQPEEEMIIAEGKHQAIVDRATFDKAKALFEPPRLRAERTLHNPLAGLLFCGKCGKALHRKTYKAGTPERYTCRTNPTCYRSIRVDDLVEGLVYGLEHAELPDLQMKVKNGDGNSRKMQERLVAKLEKQMDEYREQEDTQYDLLETREYTPEVFKRRNGALRKKMDECQEALKKAKASLPESVNYEEKVVALQTAIEALKDPEATAAEKNRIAKAIIKRIEYTGEDNRGSTKGIKQYLDGPPPFKLDVTLRL